MMCIREWQLVLWNYRPGVYSTEKVYELVLSYCVSGTITFVKKAKETVPRQIFL